MMMNKDDLDDDDEFFDENILFTAKYFSPV